MRSSSAAVSRCDGALVDVRQDTGEAPDRLAAEEDVGSDRKVIGEGEVLVDGLDAAVARLARRRHVEAFARQMDGTGVGLVDAGDVLDQRRLAGTVVADQRQHLAAGEARGRPRAAPRSGRSSCGARSMRRIGVPTAPFGASAWLTDLHNFDHDWLRTPRETARLLLFDKERGCASGSICFLWAKMPQEEPTGAGGMKGEAVFKRVFNRALEQVADGSPGAPLEFGERPGAHARRQPDDGPQGAARTRGRGIVAAEPNGRCHGPRSGGG